MAIVNKLCGIRLGRYSCLSCKYRIISKGLYPDLCKIGLFKIKANQFCDKYFGKK